jgi:AraC family transcriptional regulator
MKPKLADMPGFTVMGLIRKFTPQTMPQIPKLWEEFAPGMDALPGRKGKRSFGLMLDHTWGDNPIATYMVAIEVEPATAPPKGMELRQVPAARYAVWTFEDHISGIGPFIQGVYEEWLPASGLAHTAAPDFEMYDERWTPERGPLDYCIPVELL